MADSEIPKRPTPPANGQDWLLGQLRKSFVAGLSVLIPLYLTVYILDLVISLGDSILYVMPPQLQPPQFQWFRGAGLMLSLSLVLLAGVLVRNIFGRMIFSYFNSLMERIPFVASLYSLFRQISEVFLGNKASGFKTAVLVEWPRPGAWTIGFVGAKTTGMLLDTLQKHESGSEWLNVFIPATPNPTSGFFFMVRACETIPLKCTVEQAFKTIISAGVLTPDQIAAQDALR